MSAELFVGIGIGTSGVRAILIDRDGQVRGQAAHPLAPATQIRAQALVVGKPIVLL
jgi:sugar (pentulose or hexulose) kinase